MTDPWARPADEAASVPPVAPPPVPPVPPVAPAPVPPVPPAPPAAVSPPPGPVSQGDEPTTKSKGLFRDPLSIVLVVVIVVALAAAGVVGAELYARHVANSLVAQATGCVVQDKVDVSFGGTPFLLQYFSQNYGNIRVTTAGNQIREAKGMKADIRIDDVRLADSPTSTGTIGSLNSTITWSAEGIKETIQDMIPLIGSFVTSVKPNPNDGTIELDAPLGSIIAKPQVVNNEMTLSVEGLTGLGFTLPRESVQPALDLFIAQLSKNYPLGIHADSVQVTDAGVIAKFSTQNATIPAGSSDGKGNNSDPCFAGVYRH